MNLCLLMPAIIGLICALLGYILGRATSRGAKNAKEIESLKDKNTSLQTELKECKEKLPSTEEKSISGDKEITETSPTITTASAIAPTPAAEAAFNAELAKSVFGKVITQNDLKIIEGIGPKIAELFNNNGINTWKELADTSIEKCQEVLNSGGDRYKMHNPETWPKQAQLAYEGKWQELFDLQKALDGGK
ncbi:hypothetical protein [Abyssalbus ytuae]|uniref:Uncharacterized protein n=1 Tax=Abyssalbus ytuae TaxID=2926907 RepID=A0A9E7A1D5_9FLAO|nr:hypothetical protein [Abyssalbus ytuae]UOB19207.1 hypothetical protein MQE35_07880 [Abyssalbus ytuae]